MGGRYPARKPRKARAGERAVTDIPTLSELRARREKARAAWVQDKRGNRHRHREYIAATAAYVALAEFLKRQREAA